MAYIYGTAVLLVALLFGDVLNFVLVEIVCTDRTNYRKKSTLNCELYSSRFSSEYCVLLAQAGQEVGSRRIRWWRRDELPVDCQQTASALGRSRLRDALYSLWNKDASYVQYNIPASQERVCHLTALARIIRYDKKKILANSIRTRRRLQIR